MESEKPPSTLPCGKANPAYAKWYRTTEAGKAAFKKYNASDKAKAHRKAKYGETFPNGRLVCIDCKSAYDKMAVVERGWRRIGRFNCVCDLCA